MVCGIGAVPGNSTGERYAEWREVSKKKRGRFAPPPLPHSNQFTLTIRERTTPRFERGHHGVGLNRSQGLCTWRDGTRFGRLLDGTHAHIAAWDPFPNRGGAAWGKCPGNTETRESRIAAWDPLASVPNRDSGAWRKCLGNTETREFLTEGSRRGENVGVRASPSTPQFLPPNSPRSSPYPLAPHRRRVPGPLCRIAPSPHVLPLPRSGHDSTSRRPLNAKRTIRYYAHSNSSMLLCA